MNGRITATTVNGATVYTLVIDGRTVGSYPTIRRARVKMTKFWIRSMNERNIA